MLNDSMAIQSTESRLEKLQDRLVSSATRYRAKMVEEDVDIKSWVLTRISAQAERLFMS